MSLFLFNSSHAENTLNLYGLDFVIPKKLKGNVINLGDYESVMGKEFDTQDINFFGNEEAIIDKNSKGLMISSPKFIKLLKGNFQKNIENLISRECQSVRTEEQCLKKLFRIMSPSFFIIASEKFDTGVTENDIIKATKEEFETEILGDVTEFEVEDIGTGKFKNFEIIVDQKKNPILFASFDINLEEHIFGVKPAFNYEINMYFFTFNNRIFIMFSECGLVKRCKSIRSEMNLVISKFININNAQKINTDDGKILINAVGGLRKAYQIRKMYKFLLILL